MATWHGTHVSPIQAHYLHLHLDPALASCACSKHSICYLLNELHNCSASEFGDLECRSRDHLMGSQTSPEGRKMNIRPNVDVVRDPSTGACTIHPCCFLRTHIAADLLLPI